MPTLAEKLADIRTRKSGLERQRRDLADSPLFSAEYIAEVSPGQQEEQDAYDRRQQEIGEFDAQLAAVRSEEETTLLDFILERAAQTNEILARVRDSSEAQLAATSRLEGLNRRLNVFTQALLAFTAVVSLVGFSQYLFQVFVDANYTSGAALSWVDLGDEILIMVIWGTLMLIVWMNRRER